MARRPRRPTAKTPPTAKRAEIYSHPDAKSVLRPDVGTQAQFRKKKPPRTYRYDSSLSPALDWDEQNPARERGEMLLRSILEADLLKPESLEKAQQAAGELKRLSGPFLNWAGKAERLSFDVPTLPLFVHERLATQAILETLKGHRRDQQMDLFSLFGETKRPIHEQLVRAYEFPDDWVNRLILGDALVVMNSLLHYENLGGQVQMIYMDPPYGVRFGSNFQPFVRKRDVRHNDDAELTREPEMVKAYRDTWEVGLHSYLTYLRDRLLLSRDLLAPSGSIFVQIGDENVHHVRELLDEVFGGNNFVLSIVLKKKGATHSTEPVNDFILWYARDRTLLKPTPLYERRMRPEDDPKFNALVGPDGEIIRAKGLDENEINERLAAGYEFARVNYPIVSQEPSPTRSQDFTWNGKTFTCGKNAHWRFDPESQMPRLAEARRLFDGGGRSLGGVVRWSDWPYVALSNLWGDLHGDQEPLYVVQTNRRAVARCMLMATKPGDLVLDPTCGSGTTAFVAEAWGRRWITIDTSRVPLALARQRLLTATHPYFQLKEPARGPAGGFVYARRQNSLGEEIGGIVPHLTLKSIAKEEPPEEKVLVDRPEREGTVTRISGPFCVEATIPTPIDWEGDGIEDSGAAEGHATFVDRMVEVLRRSPILHVGAGRQVQLRQVRRPAKTLTLSAEARVTSASPEILPGGASLTGTDPGTDVISEPGRGDDAVVGEPVAIVFGPESGAVSEKLVYEAAREAYAKSYRHLYVIGFAIQPNARKLVEECEHAVGVAATYVQATPDLMMGDLLKNMRSSQIFSVCGLPDVRVRRRKSAKAKEQKEQEYEVELRGLDLFDPATMESDKRDGDDVPAWFLDTDYNGLCFHVCQAFFPRTAAWDDLKRSLRGEFDESVWDHLAGTVSAPFAAGEHGQVAVKVIDDRGNELLVVKNLQDAEA